MLDSRVGRCLVALVTLGSFACSEQDGLESTRTGVVRLFDDPGHLTLESAFSAPNSLDDVFSRADMLLDRPLAECPSEMRTEVAAAWIDELLGLEATAAPVPFSGAAGDPGVAPRLQVLVASTKTLRTNLLALDLERELIAGETVVAFEYNAQFDRATISTPEQVETLFRTHTTFIRRLGVDERFAAGSRAKSILLEPTKVSGAIVLGIVTRNGPLTSSRVRIGRLEPRTGWLLSSPSSLADPVNPLLRPESIGGVTRRSLVIAGDAKVRATVELPSGEAMFHMHLALVFLETPIPVQVGLRFEPADAPGDESRSITRSLQSRVDAGHWVAIDQDVSALAGARVNVEIDVRSDTSKGEAILLLAEPLIEGRANQSLPDVIVISLDTTRADRTSVYGHSRRTTPNLETLAKSATVFDLAIAPAPWTLPSHVSLFSGMYPDRHGVAGPKSIVSPTTPWLPALFAARGYETLGITGGGYVNPEFGFARGFERYSITDPGYPSAEWAQARNDRAAFELALRTAEARSEIIAQLRKKRERPLFLFVHTYASHNYSPPPATLEEFGIPKERLPQLLAMQPTSDRTLSSHAAGLPAAERDQKYADARTLYDAAVHSADALVGAILDELRRSDRLDRTIVLVVSDHGEELGDRGNFGHGQSVYDEMIRIPMLWHVPHKQARRVADIVSLIDVTPTFVDLLALDPDHRLRSGAFDGRSLLPLLDGRARESLPALSRGNRRDTVFRSLRGRREKLIETRTPGDEPSRALFALDSDPQERMDLGSERGDEVRKLSSVLERTVEGLRARGQGSAETAISSDLEDQLRQLGYLGGDGG